MNPLEILSTIRQAGGIVVVVDGDLRISAPAGTITQGHRETLARHKPDLIRLLIDPEKDALRWLEDLRPGEAAAGLEMAIEEWGEITSQPAVDTSTVDTTHVKPEENQGFVSAGDGGRGYRQSTLFDVSEPYR